MTEAAYWMALGHLPKWGTAKINNLIIKFYHNYQLSIVDFFQLEENDWKEQYELSSQEISDLKKAKAELANNSFLAEALYNQGIEIVPITSVDYSRTLKQNLKASYSPPILYIKGNKKILHEKSIAIVGSRDASEKALSFTDNIAKLASEEYRVVVSGFAKGVDKQALDSAIKYKGQSIIVLPQGIMTFGSGFKTYYKQILDGDVLVLSTFFPKAVWKAGLAMARNPIIYGLADEIYVAESSDKGGTWEGVMDGLKKKRRIFVRLTEIGEKNANKILIQKGGIPVNFDGKEIIYNASSEQHAETKDQIEDSESELSLKVKKLLEQRPLTAAEIISNLEIKDKPERFKRYLKELSFLEVKKSGRFTYYKLKDDNFGQALQPILF